MIKSLLGEDEEQKKEESKPENTSDEKKLDVSSENLRESEEISNDVEKSDIKTQEDVTSQAEIETDDEIESIEEIKTAIETGNLPPQKNETVKPFEINRPIGQPGYEKQPEENNHHEEPKNSEAVITKSNRELELERKLAEIEAELLAEKESQEKIKEEEKRIEEAQRQKELEKVVEQSPDIPAEKDIESKSAEVKTEDNQKVNIAQKEFKPESKGETIRKTGLAYSAAVALVGSIIFLMILGWFVDLLIGSNPWGIVVGIILGAIMGFVQFVRITSQIHKPKPNDFEKVSLRSNLEEAKPVIETGTKDEISDKEQKDDEAEKNEVISSEVPNDKTLEKTAENPPQKDQNQIN